MLRHSNHLHCRRTYYSFCRTRHQKTFKNQLVAPVPQSMLNIKKSVISKENSTFFNVHTQKYFENIFEKFQVVINFFFVYTFDLKTICTSFFNSIFGFKFHHFHLVCSVNPPTPNNVEHKNARFTQRKRRKT